MSYHNRIGENARTSQVFIGPKASLSIKSDTKVSHHFLTVSTSGCIRNKKEIYEPPDITTATGYQLAYAYTNITNVEAANTMNLDEKLANRDN